MIRKLRYKFVAIMMSMVAAILLAVFASLIIANERSSARNAEITMQQGLLSSLGRERFKTPPGMKMKDIEGGPVHMFPSVVVKIDGGEITRIQNMEMEVEEETLESWIEYAKEHADADGYGTIKSGNIRYNIRSFEDETNLIFADFSFEVRERRKFILLCAAGFLVSGMAFFILSWFLSGWVVRPVKETWEKQSRFIADASHELKTPLTVMLADTNILLSHGENRVEEQKRWIESIRDEALSMKKLVEDMLFLAKSDAERNTAGKEEFDVSDVVTDKVLEFEAVAYEKQVELCDSIEKGLRMTGDKNEFGRLAAVLLDNAVKYAEPDDAGRKQAQVSLKRKGRKLYFTVSNSCGGLSEDTIRHAFDRFYRGDATRNRMDGSYGLGLSIAAEIVHAMDGKISCSCSGGLAVFEAVFSAAGEGSQ